MTLSPIRLRLHAKHKLGRNRCRGAPRFLSQATVVAVSSVRSMPSWVGIEENLGICDRFFDMIRLNEHVHRGHRMAYEEQMCWSMVQE